MIKCASCKELKPEQEFGKNKLRKSGHEPYCKVCKSKKHKKDYVDNLFLYMHRLKKSECKKKAIDYNLDPEYLESIWTGVCPVYNVPLVVGNKKHQHQYSLDRIEPSKGYVKGNVCFISSRANRIKYDADELELEMIAKWLRSVKESSTTIPKGSTAKWLEAPSPSKDGDDIVCSTR